MSLVARFFVVFFCLMLAIIAAGLALAIGVAVPDFVTVSAEPMEHIMVLGGWFFATGIIVFYGFGLMLVAVAIAEVFDIRSIFYYALGGAAIGAFAYYTSDFSVFIENSTDIPPVRFSLQLVAAAGIIGGFVYWLFAGRNAGRWKTRLV
jgi:hypothetical protein